ncbi:Tn3 family transposase [Streptomyces sp. NPDC052721]|uniref:Tn3 family transposase n=1 Tax=Streptomyces sp. NPDC052721 TaxID=3154955 RepID=UPI0034466DC0
MGPSPALGFPAFRQVGRMIRTVELLRYLSDAPRRRRVTAATNKMESFNRFSQWIGFGNRGVIADNSTHELGIQPVAYDPKLDVGFAQNSAARVSAQYRGLGR